MQLLAKLGPIMTIDVRQLDLLQLVPDPFDRIQVWGIAGQPLDMQPRCSLPSQECLDRFVAVDQDPVPDDEQLSGQLPQQIVPKAHHSCAGPGARAYLHQQLALSGNVGHDRQMLPTERPPQHGGLAAPGISPRLARQQIEAGLVYPDDDPARLLGFFLSAGQRWADQSAMVASSRWVARTMGFCTVQPSWRRRRPTCVGW